MAAGYETSMVIKFIKQKTMLETIKDFHRTVPQFEYMYSNLDMAVSHFGYAHKQI